MKTDHIVLIGFKHVGKSVVGKKLSETLQMPFVDLDKEIEYDYEQATGCRRSCREIMEIEKEPYFRELESFSLVRVLKGKKAIISVGGGTPLLASNQALLKDCRVIHITASRGIVFERILVTGRPEFFNPDQDLLTSFNQLDRKSVV